VSKSPICRLKEQVGLLGQEPRESKTAKECIQRSTQSLKPLGFLVRILAGIAGTKALDKEAGGDPATAVAS
jgi:hypothetical protein